MTITAWRLCGGVWLSGLGGWGESVTYWPHPDAFYGFRLVCCV